ncbi:SIS domain-containing protein [Synechococcales cyanobacterium C]|uniref:Glutamine--fructose-6-phosphate aminotransferase [isomerizing] n=1 Tax=Petrachloros mirabilis ULC683 TaxID=2781853 RepID=A0A8K2A7V3_9CYAN|nr:SIS domain-containing protein [Petrachloros mirabilis]NCJ06475.1 SIS domain-containing protein [Petrachloros mirabilis ULC683]
MGTEESAPMNYLANILEQPQVLRAILKTYHESPLWDELRQQCRQQLDPTIVLTGMGASYNALLPTYLSLLQAGFPALRVETSELLYYVPALWQRPCCLVVVSQSGESIEIRRLLEQIQDQAEQGLPTPLLISVTNQADNHLARHSTVNLCTQAGAEVGVATKTYTSTLLLLNLMRRTILGDLQDKHYQQWYEIADAQAAFCADWEAQLAPIQDQLRVKTHWALVGRGPAIASAHSGALIFKEATRVPAEGFSGGQFRHGPFELLSPNLGVILFTTGKTAELSQRLAQDILKAGTVPICIGNTTIPDAIQVPLPVVEECLQPCLEILVIQLLAAQLAALKGVTPGIFRWGTKVVQQE